MSYIKLPDKNNLNGEARKIWEDAEKRWGYIPNIQRTYALAPEVMKAEDRWSKGVMYKGYLPRKLKEAIATVVSAVNNCNYCASSHAVAITIAGGVETEAIACKMLDFSKWNEKDRAALEFAKKATINAGSITRTDIERLQKIYTDGEIVEIATVIQQFMGYNWFVTIFGLELEETNFMKDIPLSKKEHNKVS